MDRREPPRTDEGWYALHDFRTIDWDAWRDAPERERERALAEGVEYLDAHERVADADDGASATFSVLGHKADLLVVHLRPSMADLDRAERRFERTALAGFTEQSSSYVSVTEVSGYMSAEYFEEGEEVEDSGMARYIASRLHPEIPDAEYVCFYPMNKRRDAEYNWYDLPFDERADLMANHGEIGRKYGGKVTQIITGSVGFDDWEWGVTLFADDPVNVKDLLYEMRFDPSTSRYAEFGQFYVGRRVAPSDLGALLAGEAVPAEDDGGSHAHGEPHHGGTSGGHHDEGGTAGGSHGDGHGDRGDDSDGDIRGQLADLDIYAGQPHGEDVYAMVLYSAADPDELFDAVDGLRGNFEHYDTHVKTAVYEASAATQSGSGDAADSAADAEHSAVVSIWETESAADTAGGFLADLPGVVGRPDDEDGFGTMGMFYTVEPDHRDAFVEKFETVGDLLTEMDGHRETTLLANREDANDMFIASQWDGKEDAMAFFRSDAFGDTVDWGRDVLADRPRHVFMA